MKIDLPNSLEIKTRKADNRGRVALGPEYADKEVTVLVLQKEAEEEE